MNTPEIQALQASIESLTAKNDIYVQRMCDLQAEKAQLAANLADMTTAYETAKSDTDQIRDLSRRLNIEAERMDWHMRPGATPAA